MGMLYPACMIQIYSQSLSGVACLSPVGGLLFGVSGLFTVLIYCMGYSTVEYSDVKTL